MVNRYICTVLEEMREYIKIYDDCNFHMDSKAIHRLLANLAFSIEEEQQLANRMEAALEDVSDYESIIADMRDKKKEIRELRKEIINLSHKRDELFEKVEKLESKTGKK